MIYRVEMILEYTFNELEEVLIRQKYSIKEFPKDVIVWFIYDISNNQLIRACSIPLYCVETY